MRKPTAIFLVSLVTLPALACGEENASPPLTEASGGSGGGAAGQGDAPGAGGGGSPGSSGSGGSSAGSDTGQGGSGAGQGGGDSGGAGGSDGGGSSTAGSAGSPQGNGWGADRCEAPTAAVGFQVGQSLGKLVVKDCETGAEATLDELCGAQATWIFVAHTHCPTCQATAKFTDEVAAEVASKDVAVAHIVYDDNGVTCAAWKETYKLGGYPNLRVYEDPTGAAWSKIKSSNYTAPSVILDRDRVITFQGHGLSKAKVLGQIDAALAK